MSAGKEDVLLLSSVRSRLPQRRPPPTPDEEADAVEGESLWASGSRETAALLREGKAKKPRPAKPPVAAPPMKSSKPVKRRPVDPPVSSVEDESLWGSGDPESRFEGVFASLTISPRYYASDAFAEPGVGDPDDGDMLKKKFPTSFDLDIRFVEEGHYYLFPDSNGTFRKNRLAQSVSGIKEAITGKFPEEFASSGVARSNRKRLTGSVEAYAKGPRDRTCLAAHFGDEAADVLSRDPAFNSVFERLGKADPSHLKSGFEELAMAMATSRELKGAIGSRFGSVDAAGVRGEWSRSAAHGTDIHRKIEHYLNGLPYDASYPEMDTFFSLTKQYPWLGKDNIFRTELSMSNREWLVTGQLDALYHSHTTPGEYTLVDWKVCRDFEKPRAPTAEFRKAFPDFKVTKRSIYEVQLGLYHWLLWSRGYRVNAMYLVVLHVDHQGERVLRAPLHADVVAWLLRKHEDRMKTLIESSNV